jgi:hypothetical protein
MWMDACIHQILIRQQIAHSDRHAALQHMVQTAALAGPPRDRWAAVRRWARSAAHAWTRHPEQRPATR